MTQLGLVYFSGSGTTKRLTEAVVNACSQADVALVEVEIIGPDIVEGRWQNDTLAARLDECDAIMFGSPTYMGGVAAQLKAFFDAMAPRWYQQSWQGKLGAGFTVSAKVAGDKLNCLQDMHTFAMQMGMLWLGSGSGVANAHGFYLGEGIAASGPDEVDADALAAVRALTERVIQQLK